MNENQGEMLDEKDDEEMAEKILEAIKESVPEENQEELAEKIVEQTKSVPEPQPEKGIDAIKWLFKNAVPRGNAPATTHKKRGVGITRKNREESKARRKQAAKSRKINRK